MADELIAVLKRLAELQPLLSGRLTWRARADVDI